MKGNNKMILMTNTLIFLCVLLFISCDGECSTEEIEKVEWVTSYVKVHKDTLVSYSMVEDKIDYQGSWAEISSGSDKLQAFNGRNKFANHLITIKNNNSLYSGYFAIKLIYGYWDKTFYMKTETNDYVKIDPKSTYSFKFHVYADHPYTINRDVIILQTPTKISYMKRIDELSVEKIKVNSCKDNIPALKEKYKTIKKLYQQKIDTIHPETKPLY